MNTQISSSDSQRSHSSSSRSASFSLRLDFSLLFLFSEGTALAVKREVVLVGLRHLGGFMREAVLTYLKVASPKTCYELLSVLQDDPDPLVASQVDSLKNEFAQRQTKGKFLQVKTQT